STARPERTLGSVFSIQCSVWRGPVDLSFLAQLMSDDLGQGLPAFSDSFGTLAHPSQFVPQVFAFRVFRDRYSEIDSGLERAAELPGQVGHLHRVANGLVPIVEFLVASAKPIELRFLADQFGGSSRLPVLLRQLSEAVKGRPVGRIRCDQAS